MSFSQYSFSEIRISDKKESQFTKKKRWCVVVFSFPAESSHLPIQLQCPCPFASVIKVGGINCLNPSDQLTPAENTYPGIEAAADEECRQQQSYEMERCDLYLKDFNVHLHPGT